MSGQTENTVGTIRLHDSDLIEVDFAAHDEVTGKRDATVASVPAELANEVPTQRARTWDVGAQRTPTQDEITAVSRRRAKKEREWVDIHAVVDDEGRLRLPENVAKQLQPGAIVELRLAAWAVPDGVEP